MKEFDVAFPRQKALFAALMSFTILLRAGLLFQSQKYLQSDEALVGMMALDIMEGRGVPIFPYGNSYGGGHVVEALLMIPGFMVFGSSEALVAVVPAIIGCAVVALVYFWLKCFFGPRLAFVASLFFSLSAPFVAYNFYVNGSMTTLFFAWLGVHLFYSALFRAPERSGTGWMFFLSGAALGFACYCFDYALFYLLAIALPCLVERRPSLKAVSLFAIGCLAGAMPLIGYDFTHDFAHLKNLLSRTVDNDAASGGDSMIHRILLMITQAVPAFMGRDIYDFPVRISWIAHLVYFLVVVAFFHLLIIRRKNLAVMLHQFGRAGGGGRADLFHPDDRIAYILILAAAYILVVSMASSGADTPRYLLPLYPLVPILLAASVLEVARWSVRAAWSVGVLFIVAQFWFIAQLATDKTTEEWRMPMHGGEMEEVVRFLDGQGITTVMAPYEIKWKLMFTSRRRIVCAAYMFGFDRESRWNREAIDRVNRLHLPLAVIFDRDYRLLEIAKQFNPKEAFDLNSFKAGLERRGITWKMTSVGRDTIIWHDFSNGFLLPPYRPAEAR